MGGALALIVQLAVAALLLFSFVGKVLAGRDVNVGHLEKYRLVPTSVLPWATALLLPTEFMFGAGLVVRVGLRFLLLGSAALFVVFAAAMMSALQLKIVTQCGCYGTLHTARVSPRLVVRNLVIAALLLVMACTSAGHDVVFARVGTGMAAVLLGSLFVVGLAVSEVMSSRLPRRDPVPQ